MIENPSYFILLVIIPIVIPAYLLMDLITTHKTLLGPNYLNTKWKKSLEKQWKKQSIKHGRETMKTNIIPIESCPGHYVLKALAKQSGYIEGGITFVTDTGNFLHVPIKFDKEIINHEELFLRIMHQASMELSKELSRLK